MKINKLFLMLGILLVFSAGLVYSIGYTDYEVYKGTANVKANEKSGSYWDGKDIGYKSASASISISNIKQETAKGTLSVKTKDNKEIYVNLDPKSNVQYNSMVDIDAFSDGYILVTQGAWVSTITRDYRNRKVTTKEYGTVQYQVYPNERMMEFVIVGANPIIIDFDKISVSLKMTIPPVIPSCTYTYSSWGDCVNNVQTRTVVLKTPTGCVENPAPVLSQSCVIPTPSCVYTYSEWSECLNNKKTRTVLSKSPAGCLESPAPVLEQGCSHPTNPVNP